MHRFYCPHADFSQGQIILTDPKETHHLKHVLRLKEGDEVEVFNGQAREASGRITSIEPDGVRVQIQSVTRHERPIPFITLACAVPKKSKFEMIIEKATEAGVDEVIPLKTERTQVWIRQAPTALSGPAHHKQWAPGRGEKKNTRYQTIAVNAAKQCQRPTVPVIHPMIDFAAAVERLRRDHIVFIPSLTGRRENIFAALGRVKQPRRIAFLIGPEGDFTAQEYEAAWKAGCIPVSLGNNVLRVETAAIVSVALGRLYYL